MFFKKELIIYRIVMAYIIGYTQVLSFTKQYRWSRLDERFDCVVGIEYNKQHVSTGVFISANIVLTSRNPIERYVKDPSKMMDLKIHIVASLRLRLKKWFFDYSFYFTKSTDRGGLHATSPFNEPRMRSKSEAPFWQPMNNETGDNAHTTANDLYTLAVMPDFYADKIVWTHVVQSKWFGTRFWFHRYLVADMVRNKYNQLDRNDPRRPMVAKVPNKRFTMSNNYFMYAGFNYPGGWFGYHFLYIEYFGKKAVLRDCAEYFVRTFIKGAFICIENYNGYTTISGAPLFNKGVLVGIGSFSLQYGDEDIHVFTDLRPYFNEDRMEIDDGIFKGMWIAFIGPFRLKDWNETRMEMWDIAMTRFHVYMLGFRKVKRLYY